MVKFALHCNYFNSRLPQIYDEFYHTVNNADHEKGGETFRVWPFFTIDSRSSCLVFILSWACYFSLEHRYTHHCGCVGGKRKDKLKIEVKGCNKWKIAKILAKMVRDVSREEEKIFFEGKEGEIWSSDWYIDSQNTSLQQRATVAPPWCTGPAVVVQYSRGQHGHGLAPIRGNPNITYFFI